MTQVTQLLQPLYFYQVGVQTNNILGYDGIKWTNKIPGYAVSPLYDAASIAWDLSSQQSAKVTLGGNRTLANPTNQMAGASYTLMVRQDSTGSRTLSYGSAFKWPGGSAPTLTTAAGATDILNFVSDGTYMLGSSSLNYTVPSFIKSVQTGSITISSGNTSNTATISSVTAANTMLIYHGINSSQAGNTNYNSLDTRITLTNGTTVTATRGASNSDSVTVAFTAVEFNSNVNSIQYGTVNMNGVLNNTAAISAVGSNSFILWLGSSTPSTAGGLDTFSSTGVQLTNSTTVTGFCANTSLNMTVGFVVVDLSSTLIKSVQQKSHTDATTATVYTDTINPINVDSSLIFHNGNILNNGVNTPSFAHMVQITNGTTVTITRGNGAVATTRTVYYTVVEFQPGVMANKVSRGTVTLTASTNNNVTIPTRDLNKSFSAWGGFIVPNIANFNATYPIVVLGDVNEIDVLLNSSGTITAPYEAAQFT